MAIIYGDSYGNVEALDQQKQQADVSNYFRTLEALRARAALQSQLASAAADRENARQSMALNMARQNRDAQNQNWQQGFSERGFANQIANNADSSKRGWAGLNLERRRIDVGNPKSEMYAMDRAKEDILETGLTPEQAAAANNISLDQLPALKALAEIGKQQRDREATMAESVAANLNRVPTLTTLKNRLGEVKTETDWPTEAPMTADEKARLTKADTGWFTNGARNKYLTGTLAPQRQAQIDQEIATLTQLQKAAADYGVTMGPNGQWFSTVRRPGTAPTANPDSPYKLGGMYRMPDGTVAVWNGQTLVPKR